MPSTPAAMQGFSNMAGKTLIYQPAALLLGSWELDAQAYGDNQQLFVGWKQVTKTMCSGHAKLSWLQQFTLATKCEVMRIWTSKHINTSNWYCISSQLNMQTRGMHVSCYSCLEELIT